MRKQGISTNDAKTQAFEEFKSSSKAVAYTRSYLEKALQILQNPEPYLSSVNLGLLDRHAHVIVEKIPIHEDLLLSLFSPLFSSPTSSSSLGIPEPIEPRLENYRLTAGVIGKTSDGRFVLIEPADHFAGVLYGIPKGGQNEHETLQQTAIREFKEETGFDVQITSYLGDYLGGSTLNRIYIGSITGGDPSKAGFETDRIHLVPEDKVREFLMLNTRKWQILPFDDHKKNITRPFSLDLESAQEELEGHWSYLEDYFPKKDSTAALNHREDNRSELSMPFDFNRVHLEGGSYINASNIRLSSLDQLFIAAEAPLPHTFERFWQMAFETAKNGEALIAMVTDVEPLDKSPIFSYWPGAHSYQTFGSIQIENIEEISERNWIKRTFRLQKEDQTKIIHHLQFINWEDKKTVDPATLGQYVQRAKGLLSKEAPIIAHCRRGQGRTGAFILTYALVYGRSKSASDLIVQMREQRYGLVPALPQAILGLRAAKTIK